MINKRQILRYLKQIPTLIVGVFFYVLAWGLVQRVFPQTIQHWVWPNSYLPLGVLFWLASFFVISFILLSTRRGLLISSWLTFGLYLRLWAVTNWLLVWVVLAIVLLLIELGIWWWSTRFGFSNHKDNDII